MYFGIALLVAGLVSVIGGGANFIALGGNSRERVGPTIVGAVLSFVVNFFICLSILWWALPARTGTLGGWAWIWLPLTAALIIFVLCDLAAKSTGVGTIATGIGWFFIIVVAVYFAFPTCSTADQDYLAGLAKVEEADSTTYPETDTNHIVMVPYSNAVFKASQVLAAPPAIDQDKLPKDSKGNPVNISTNFEAGRGELQQVQGHLYYIFPLNFSGYRNWGRVSQISPGFVIVDAENPSVQAQLRLGYAMKCTPDAYLESKLQRRIYEKYPDYEIDDLTIEVDDEWNPYFTSSLNQKTLRNGGNIPKRAIIADPQTCDLQVIELNELPEWVDRIYSEETAKRLLDDWGNYREGTPEFRICCRPTSNRLKVADSGILVYTEGGHPAWQFTMTSYRKDPSIAYAALFDARTGEVKIYNNVAGTPTEGKVAETFNGIFSNQTSGNSAEHLSMHLIYGVPTWVTNFVRESAETSGKSYVGVGFVSARSVQVSDVAFAATREEALAKYRQILARNPSTAAPGETAQLEQTVRGTIGRISTQTEGGNTVYLFYLLEDPQRVFKAAREVSRELPFAEQGDQVVVTFVDVSASPIDIKGFNDLVVPIDP